MVRHAFADAPVHPCQPLPHDGGGVRSVDSKCEHLVDEAEEYARVVALRVGDGLEELVALAKGALFVCPKEGVARPFGG